MTDSRRDRLDLQHRSELAIRRAIIEVEVLEPNDQLSEAIQLMRKAKSLVADHFDKQIPWNNSMISSSINSSRQQENI